MIVVYCTTIQCFTSLIETQMHVYSIRRCIRGTEGTVAPISYPSSQFQRTVHLRTLTLNYFTVPHLLSTFGTPSLTLRVVWWYFLWYFVLWFLRSRFEQGFEQYSTLVQFLGDGRRADTRPSIRLYAILTHSLTHSRTHSLYSLTLQRPRTVFQSFVYVTHSPAFTQCTSIISAFKSFVWGLRRKSVMW